MTNNSNRFLKGLMLGSSLLGLGYYVSNNKKLKEQISTKFNDVLTTYEVKDKFNTLVDDTKSRVNSVIGDTKSSLGESLDKTSRQFSDTVNRLACAFNAGRAAAKESLNNSKSDTSIPADTRMIKDSKESPLGAIEDTSVDNTSPLHPSSNNIAKSVGDAGTNFDKTTSGKSSNERFGSDKFTGI